MSSTSRPVTYIVLQTLEERHIRLKLLEGPFSTLQTKNVSMENSLTRDSLDAIDVISEILFCACTATPVNSKINNMIFFMALILLVFGCKDTHYFSYGKIFCPHSFSVRPPLGVGPVLQPSFDHRSTILRPYMMVRWKVGWGDSEGCS